MDKKKPCSFTKPFEMWGCFQKGSKMCRCQSGSRKRCCNREPPCPILEHCPRSPSSLIIIIFTSHIIGIQTSGTPQTLPEGGRGARTIRAWRLCHFEVGVHLRLSGIAPTHPPIFKSDRKPRSGCVVHFYVVFPPLLIRGSGGQSWALTSISLLFLIWSALRFPPPPPVPPPNFCSGIALKEVMGLRG